jgi:phage regulator Rha-like protein
VDAAEIEARHDNVKISIERLAKKGVIVQPAMQDEAGTDASGRPRPISVYLLDKRSSLIVLAQVDAQSPGRFRSVIPPTSRVTNWPWTSGPCGCSIRSA